MATMIYWILRQSINGFLYLLLFPALIILPFILIDSNLFSESGSDALEVAYSLIMSVYVTLLCILIIGNAIQRSSSSGDGEESLKAEGFLLQTAWRMTAKNITDSTVRKVEYFDGSSYKDFSDVTILTKKCRIKVSNLEEQINKVEVVVWHGMIKVDYKFGKERKVSEKCKILQSYVNGTDLGAMIIRYFEIKKIKKCAKLVNDVNSI